MAELPGVAVALELEIGAMAVQAKSWLRYAGPVERNGLCLTRMSDVA